MRTWHSRYIFTEFADLQKVKFKKLQKVCDRIYVFIHADQTHIPFKLAKQMQKWGKRIKWILVDGAPASEMSNHIAFYLGKLHEKTDPHIEFAILSNDDDFDALIQFVNAQGRSCIRVRTRKSIQKVDADANNGSAGAVDQKEAPATLIDEVHEVIRSKPSFTEVAMEVFGGMPNVEVNTESISVSPTRTVEVRPDLGFSEAMIERTAEDTLRRLVRSGNRPAELDTLKEYIMLHNEEVASDEVIDRVIQKLEAREAITVKGQEVQYHF